MISIVYFLVGNFSMLDADIMDLNFNMFSLCVWLLVTHGVVFGNKPRCFGTSSTGESISYCCDNHVEQNGTCVECKPGFESVNDSPCTLCLPGNYGRKCGEVCACVKERCHHVLGCVDLTDIPVSTVNQDVQFSIIEKLFTLTTRLPTSPSTEEDKSSIFSGLSRREIIIYSISAGFLSFILLFCTFLLRRYKQRNSNTRPFPNASSPEQISNDGDIPITGASIDGGDGIYETIDESSIPDILVPRADGNLSNASSGSSSDDNNDPLPNDGYLNPYQPMTQEILKHGYSTLVDKSNSDCSSSNNGERVSEYLNPYQKIVPDQDKHEYYKVNGETYLEKDNTSDYSDQCPNGAYTDARSYRTSENTGHGENENQSKKAKPSDYADGLDIDKKDDSSICVAENKLSHNEDQRTCDIELKRCIDERVGSSDKGDKVGHCHEVSELSDTLEATCHFNVIIDKNASDFPLKL